MLNLKYRQLWKLFVHVAAVTTAITAAISPIMSAKTAVISGATIVRARSAATDRPFAGPAGEDLPGRLFSPCRCDFRQN